MFEGFNDSTIKYFELMVQQNDKDVFKRNQLLYEEGIKIPCEQLFYELAVFFADLDLTINKRRCLSSPYNDARFCAARPMKEYIYLRFKVALSRQDNLIGFFFDASKMFFKYGLNIYNLNSRGMEKIRQEILNNKRAANRLIKQFENNSSLQLVGQSYVKENYLEENKTIRKWLNMKTISFHHKEEINPLFFKRKLLENMLEAYAEIKDIYFFLKKALN